MADLFNLAEGVLGKIASLAVQEAIEIYGVENEISKLRETLTALEAVLLGEEDQQSKNPGLQVWLDGLQDILYDAEDVVDELECEAMRKQVASRYGEVKEKVCHFFSLSNPLLLRDKLSHEVKEIKERLSRISTEKDQFDLNDVRSADDRVAHMHSREMTYSFVKKSNVIRGDTDKKKIVEMLMQSSDDEDLSVIPIIGIGGLGKTTLAKLVYNDDSVKEQFELRLWVCVPKDFDLKKIIGEIIKDATAQSSSNLDIQQLHTRLQDIIRDKKYLLVLDDVWSDDLRRWEELRDLLSVGASESKIIVTTRSSEIAFIMGTRPAHNLEGLSHEDSVALFKKWAFGEKEKQARPELLEIGNDIVKKSQGLPRIAIILGKLLRTKDEESYWAYIRDSETWELAELETDIVPVIKLSYDDLPPHLKRCFPILSFFPKGVEIRATKLIRLWMALGLISTREKVAPEDIGVGYVKELWRRSLIQDVVESGKVLRFRVHDLIRSLAMTVGKSYCSTVGLDIPETSEKVRHIWTPTTSLDEIPNYAGVPPFLRKRTSKRLRAILFQYAVDDRVITRKFAKTCISKCNHLRILDLSYGSFEELPSSICNLKQLRSLNLLMNKRLKKLPDTICELQSLLQLNLNGCSELDELPKNMKRLVSLRYLYITTKQESLQESGIQYLDYLYFLGLGACENLQILFEGAFRLTCLQGLEIRNCGRLISVPFGEFISLERLAIESCPPHVDPAEKIQIPFASSCTVHKKFRTSDGAAPVSQRICLYYGITSCL